MSTVTNNRNLTVPQVGGDSGTWGTLLNNGVMDYLDNILGATQAITIDVADVTLTVNQWNNAAFNLTGTLTGNRSLILPFNANSVTVAVGGLFVVANNTTGAYNITVKTAASGSTGVTVPQGARAFLYSDTVNVYNADDARFQFINYAGNPNTHVAGSAATVNNPPSVVWDYTNNILYFCTTTGNAASAVWTAVNPVAQTLPVTPLEGYLTPVSNQPIITSDSLSASVIYYTPFVGTWGAIHNGTGIIPYQFSQMQLTLSSSQAANNIYDAFLVYNGGVPVIGTGPSWLDGGGSITAGSCARGTGAGSTALTRLSGLWVNTNSMSLIYNTGSGNNTIVVSAQQAIYLGSLYIDATPGQVTCHRSYGQSRKWGIFNAYNRQNTYLKVGDSTASWTYNSVGWRSSNGNSANSLSVFQGLAEEVYNFRFEQSISIATNIPNAQVLIGVGFNSTSASFGKSGIITVIPGGANTIPGDMAAIYEIGPSLGINTISALENTAQPSGGSLVGTFNGTETNMILSAQWRA